MARHTRLVTADLPEGKRSRTGELMPFHGGPAILAALGQGVPVLPIYIQGAADILPPGTKVLATGVRAQSASVTGCRFRRRHRHRRSEAHYGNRYLAHPREPRRRRQAAA